MWTVLVPFCVLLAVFAAVVIVKENTGSAEPAVAHADETPTAVLE